MAAGDAASSWQRTEAVMAARLRLLERAPQLTMTELLQATLDETEALTGSVCGFYHFVEPDGETLSLQAWSTNTQAHMCTAEGAGLHYAVAAAGVWADAVREGRALIHNDLPSLPHLKGMPEGHVPVLRELVVPVLRAGGVVAVLGVGNKPTDYDDGDLELVTLFADLAWSIAETKRAHEALAASEARLQALLDAAPVAIGAEREGKSIYLNRRALELFGYPPDADLHGTPLSQFVAPSHRAAVAALVRAQAAGAPFAVDDTARGRRADGSEFDLEVDFAAVELADGPATIAFLTDTTERNRMVAELAASEARLHALLDGAPVAIGAERGGRAIYLNRRALELFGYPPETDLRGAPLEQFVAPSRHAGLAALVAAHAAGRMLEVAPETRGRRADGSEFDMQVGFAPVELADGPATIAFFTDTTERNRAQAQLAASEERFRALLDAAPVAIGAERDAQAIYFNRSALELFGYPPDADLSGTPVPAFIAPSHHAQMEAVYLEHLRGGPTPPVPFTRGRRADGSEFDMHVGFAEVALSDGPATIAFFSDTTERNRALAELAASEERFRSLLDNAPVAIGVSREGRVVYLNRRALALFGYPPEADLAGRSILDLNAPCDHAMIVEQLRRRMAGEPYATDYHVHGLRADGSQFDMVVSSTLVQLADGPASIAFFADVTDHKRAQAELAASEARFRALLDGAPVAIGVSRDGSVLYINRRMREMFGYADLTSVVGAPVEEFYGLGVRAAVGEEIRTRIAGGRPARPYDTRGRRADGTEFDVHVDPTRVELADGPAAMAFFTDVTELNRAQAELEQSEERFRTLFERSLVGIYALQDGVFAYVNPAFEAMSGYTATELLGTDPSLLAHPDDRERLRDSIRDRWAGVGNERGYVVRGVRKDGRDIHVELLGTLGTLHGRPALFGNCSDVTDRVLAERALAESEERFRVMFDTALVGIYAIQDGVVAYVNPAFERIFGFSSAELVGTDPLLLAHPDDRELMRENVRRRLDGEAAQLSYILRGIRRDGREIYLEILGTRGTLRGRPAAFGNCSDVTDRVLAEQALAHSEERFRTLFESALVGIYAIQDGVIAYVNPAFERISGYSAAELQGTDPLLMAHPDDREMMRENIRRRVADGEERISYILRGFRKDGSPVHLEVLGTVGMLNGRPAAFGNCVDVTDRVLAEQARAEIEERYRLVVDAAVDGIYEVDANHVVTFASNSLATLLGYAPSELLGRGTSELIHPDEHQHLSGIRAQQLSGQPYVGEHKLLRANGEALWARLSTVTRLDAEGRPLSVLGMLTDITDQKRAESEHQRLEQQLQQAQRMESIGRLAGGVAHDFNNLLQPILGYTDMLMGELQPGDPRRDDLEEIRKAGHRGRDLTRQLLAFSRRQELNLSQVDLCATIRNFWNLLRRTVREDIAMELRCQGAPGACRVGPVRADAGQLEQVLMNLVVNAQDAIEGVGKITIELTQSDLTAADAARLGLPRAGAHAVLYARDSGCGMDEVTRARVFEPFFTTKPPGHGTGLGLATVFGIVKQHDGAVELTSAPGQGTEFAIYLPVVAPADSASAADTGAAPEGARGNETVLVVDDDQPLREMLVRLLSKHGYQVLVADGGAAGLGYLANPDQAIDLLITDVVMPEMNGAELYERAVALRPDLKALFISGYTGDTLTSRGISPTSAQLLFKPFDSAVLLAAVRRLIDAAPTV